jgi:hypothetical protein
MELKHTAIPSEFITHLPEGMKLVNRHGKQFLVVEQALGPNGESLMSEAVRIHGEPSVQLEVQIGDRRGMVFVDAYWGSHAKLYSFPLPLEDEHRIVEAFVPHTDVSLTAPYHCDIEGCNSTHGIVLRLPGGRNTTTVCARLGCPGHTMDIASIPEPVVESVSSLNYFGTSSVDDDWFDSAF